MSAALASRAVAGLIAALLALCPAVAAPADEAAGAAAAPVPPQPLSDGSAGMTCEFYNAAAFMRWERKGGDWSDAAGTPHGDRPFTNVGLVRSTVPGRVSVDLGTLPAKWTSGEAVPGGLMLRPLSGNGIADIISREGSDLMERPALLLVWDDGKRELLDPQADTTMGCPYARNFGADALVRAGAANIGVLVFPWQPRAGRRLSSAKLMLSTARVWGPVNLGVFALRTPAGGSGPAAIGLAARVRGDAGIEQQPDVLLAERFERPEWANAWVPGERRQQHGLVAADAPGRFQPLQGKALRVVIDRGEHAGVDLQLPLKRLAGGTEPEELFMRYYLRLGDDWDPTIGGGKLPGLAGTYGKVGWGGRRADGYSGWSARGQFMVAPPNDPAAAAHRGIGSYLYHVDAQDDYGDVLGWNTGPTGLLAKNRWYCVEQQVRLNRPGERDGVLRAWVDGRLAYERTDLRLRLTADLRIETVWLNVYHGGKPTAPQRLSLFIDNLVVARRYIGPMSAP